MQAPSSVKSAHISTRKAFRRVFPGVMVAMFLAAADQTILASALPTIASSLAGFSDLSWVVVGYLLAATVAAPLYGHLGDRFGRRRMLLVALGVFTGASVLCAVATSLPMLIIARSLQGLGGGGLMTLAQAMIGEHVAPRERGRFAGYFATVFALASTSGPVLGAYLTEHVSWRAVFAINIPLGIVAALLAMRIPTEPPQARERFRPDIGGATLFCLSTATLLFALSSGGHRFAWTSPWLYALVVVALLGYVALVKWEQRASDPVIPIHFLRVPAISRSCIVVLCFAATLFSTVLYLPLYLQLGRGIGIGASGLTLLPITLTMVASSTITGRLTSTTGRVAVFPRFGLLLATATLVALALTLESAPTSAVVAMTLLIGVGLGTVMPPTQVQVQLAAGRDALGAATATISISRAIGGAIGVAVVGAIAFSLIERSGGEMTAVLHHVVQTGPSAVATLSPVERAAVAARLDETFRIVFAVLAAFTAIGALFAWTIPEVDFDA